MDSNSYVKVRDCRVVDDSTTSSDITTLRDGGSADYGPAEGRHIVMEVHRPMHLQKSRRVKED